MLVRRLGFVFALGMVACNALLGTDSSSKPSSASHADGTDPDAADRPTTDPDENGSSSDQRSDSDAASNQSTPAECGPAPSDCLDPSSDDVIEVPTERTMTQALAEVHGGQTIQLRKGTTAGLIKLPPLVTFRGCDGAKLREDGTITFVGSGGSVEGLDVYGQIVANQTGSYFVRGVRCLSRESDAGASPNVCISGRSIDGLVGATVDLTVEQSYFEGRSGGIEAATRYDTLVHEVKLTARNNVFRNVPQPIDVSESGLVGKITATIAFNTFVDFDSAIGLWSMSTTTLVRGNLFSSGKRALDGDSPYILEFSAAHGLTGTSNGTPVSGTLLDLDPKLNDQALPGTSSLVVDGVTTSSASDPSDDFRRCARPHAGRTGKPLADIGAFEL
jgi:hypothetical protein